MVFTHQIRVKLFHTDAAGILFYGRIYEFTQETAEAFLEHIGFPLRVMFNGGPDHGHPFLLPIVHSEADYIAPMTVGDEITVHLKILKIGQTSLTLGFELSNQNDAKVAVAKTIQVCIDKKTRQKIPLSPLLIEKSKNYLGDEST
ncbi:MAG: acyl-CoA thioesterase [Spirochaetia bacterium]|nr:acyl-CoA thioesterase [Spirochaetia bacterium]